MIAMKNDIQCLPQIVRYHRKKSRLSQRQLAELAGIGKTAVFDLEKGKQTIQLDTIRKILAVLNLTIRFESPLMEQFQQHTKEDE